MPERFEFKKSLLTALPLPPAGQRVAYYDTKKPSLCLLVAAGGSKVFYVYRKVDGRPLRLRIGSFPAHTVEQARARADELNALLNAGENPNDRKRALRAELTFGDLYARYLTDHIRAQHKSERTLTSAWKQHLSPWAARKLSAIGKSDVAALKTRLTKAQLQAGTVNRLLGIVSALFGWAREQDLFNGENPAADIKKLKAASRERFIQADELPRFFLALAQEDNDAARDYILLSLLTGARKSNVLAMRWAEINFDRAVWTIHYSDTKTQDTYTIPLSPEALGILAARHATAGLSPWVFPGDSASGHLADPRKAWLRLFDRDELAQLALRLHAAGVAFDPAAATLGASLVAARVLAARHGVDTVGTRLHDLRLHDLRRSLGSWQAATGANLSIIGKSLGHRNVSTTAIYARLNIDPVREAMQRATSAMLAAAGEAVDADVIPRPAARTS